MARIGSVEIPVELQTDGFEAQIAETEDKLNDLLATYEILKEQDGFNEQSLEAKQLRSEIEKMQLKLEGLIDKQEKLKQSGTTAFEGMGASLEKFGKKVARVGITLLGARGIFGALSKATRTYLGANEETANKISSIWVALGNLLGPIIEMIANWILKLVGYLNVFVKTVSGGKIDLTKNMNKNTKSVKTTTGAMKELNKQLAQFDEATVLQDQKLDSGGGAGGLDVGSGLGDTEINWDALLDSDKVTKIQDFAEKVKEAALWIVDPIGQAKKLVSSWKELQDDIDNAGKKGEKYYEVQDKVKEISGDVSASIEQVTGALSANTRKVQGSHNQMQQNVNTIEEYGMVMGGLDYILKGDNSLIRQNTEQLKENANEVQDAISNNRELIKNKKLSKEQIHDLIDTYIEERSELRKVREQLPKNSKAYQEVDLAISMLSDDIRHYGDEAQYSQKKMDELWFVSKKGGEETATAFDKAIDKLGLFNKTSLLDKTAKIAIETDTNKAKNSLAGLANNVANSFQTAFNKLDLFASIRKQVNGMASDVAVSIRKVFGLARGGIVNMPGPGVPIASNVVAGERAPEGVIPLSDSQMMETLGEAIGRYITINASITNTMNGRVISRELQKINNESDFGSNR